MIREIIAWLAGFFRADRPQSMTRLCAFLLTNAGIYYALHSKDPKEAILGILVSSGGVAILLRTNGNGTGPA